ncbi:MAG: hypothetical protein JXA09_04605 [Anaerolineae bacterium]|nr:hypothetical protein [Anaerolineae bacterium]
MRTLTKAYTRLLCAGLAAALLLLLSGSTLSGHAAPAQQATSTAAGAGSYSYLNVSGGVFRPRDSGTAWTYGGFGCVYANNSGRLTVHVQLPHGSRIEYVRFYYYDASPSGSTLWLTAYPEAAGVSDLATVASQGEGGYGSALSSYIGHTVDTASNSYLLNWATGAPGSTLRVCGVRITYGQPVFLPLVTVRD